MGFGGLESNEKKLQFDFTESARTVCLGFSFVLLLTLTVGCGSLERENEQR